MSMAEKSPKLIALMDSAKMLFYKYGIRKVTVEEICREAGVSKMTFYKHYANKVELAKAFLLESHEEGMADYRAIMERQIPFGEKVKLLIQRKLRQTEGISQEFVSDIFRYRDLGLLEFMENHGKQALEEMIADFEKAGKTGEIRGVINYRFIAYFLEKMREMVADEQLMALYDTEQDLIMELTNFFFYGLGIKHDG